MTKKITPIHKNIKDSLLTTPLMALEMAIEDIGKRGALEKGKKVLILMLDDTVDEDGNAQYSVSFFQAGMKTSECHNLCEIGKNIFRQLMGY